MSKIKINPRGKIAFISGANRGIGKAIAIELLERGISKIYTGARNVDSLNDLVHTYGARIVPITLDVTDENSIKNASLEIEKLDILINNAGVFSIGGIFSELAKSSLKENLDVNVWGTLNLSNAVIDQLKSSNESAIINISSLAGLGNMPMAATYSVSKAAVHSLTQGMRAELADHNMLVMGVYPGPIETDMTAKVEMDKDSPENVAKNIVNGLENGTEDIFPDVMSEQAGAFYATNPKGIEQQFAGFIG